MNERREAGKGKKEGSKKESRGWDHGWLGGRKKKEVLRCVIKFDLTRVQ